MKQYVEITFECLPMRSIGRFDPPIDASPEYEAWCDRVKRATEKHGLHNTYYLHNAKCIFHLTNDPQNGMLEFSFEGTMLTDPEDRKTLRCDVHADLRRETCDWLTASIVRWFAETINQAVCVEFDRYITAGDLGKTVERMEQLRAQSDQHGGFMGMGL